MPKFPKSSLSFGTKDGRIPRGTHGRMDLDSVYDKTRPALPTTEPLDFSYSYKSNTKRYQKDLTLEALGDYGEVIANEKEYKALFLNALTRMLKARGETLDAGTLFSQLAHHPANYLHLDGSQPLLLMRDFTIEQKQPSERWIGRSETTTHYGFCFDFIHKKLGDKEFHEPLYEMDSRAWELLEKHGVSSEAKRRYCEQFMRMADMSGHDYIHQLVDRLAPYAHDVFPEEFHNPRVDKPIPCRIYLEQHALTLHAQICAELFHEPIKGERRKAAVLRWANETIDQIADMQNTALAHAATPEARKAVGEAITYLTEIYAHRLFRVVSPADPDLRKPYEQKNGGAAISLSDRLDKLALQTPRRLCVPNYAPTIHGHGMSLGNMYKDCLTSLKKGHHRLRQALDSNYGQPADGLDRITRHSEDWLGDTYTKIHENALSQVKLYQLGMPMDAFVRQADIDKPIFADQPSRKVHCVNAVALLTQTALPEMDKEAAQNSR